MPISPSTSRRGRRATGLLGFTTALLVATAPAATAAPGDPPPEPTAADSTVLAPPAPSTTGSTDGILLSPDELAALPTSGPAWDAIADRVANPAGGAYSLGVRDDSNTDVLAYALYGARLDDAAAKAFVRDKIANIMATPRNDGDVLATLRQLQTYVIAADLIDLASVDPALDEQFRSWLAEEVRAEYSGGGGGGSVISTHDKKPNNFGTHAGATRLAAAIYLGDEEEIKAARDVWYGWATGDPAYSTPTRKWTGTNWQCDPNQPAGINPAGCGELDGVIPEDQERCGERSGGTPCATNYIHGATDGMTLSFWMLDRLGEDPWSWGDQAAQRQMEWKYANGQEPYDGFRWQIPVIEAAYGTDLPGNAPDATSTNMGFADWWAQGQLDGADTAAAPDPEPVEPPTRGPSDGTEPDTGTDVEPDTGTDTRKDTREDAEPDPATREGAARFAGVDTREDTETDTGADVGPDRPAAAPAGQEATVTDAAALETALTEAVAGDTITLAPGTYSGQFTVTVPGVQLTGPADAVLDGGDTGSGYTLHVDGADGAQVSGLTVTGGQKGVVVDSATGVVLDGITVENVGMEAVHFRDGADGGVLRDSTVRGTGLDTPGFGEAAYVGSAESNWGRDSGGQPDDTDGVLIEGNTFAGFTAEGVDVKEGTTGTVVRGNTFDGSAVSGENFADSYVDLKGRDAVVEDNTFAAPSGEVVDAVQEHEIVPELFGGNTVTGNTCPAELSCDQAGDATADAPAAAPTEEAAAPAVTEPAQPPAPAGDVPLNDTAGPSTAHTQAVAAEVYAAVPGITSIGGSRATAKDPEGHPAGKGLDFMVPDKATGDAVNAYLKDNAERLGVDYTMWQVPDHFDHVHATLLR